MASTMRAWQYTSISGSIEKSISLTQVPAPSHSLLRKDQLLIKVISTALNPVDYKLPESTIGGLMVKSPAVPGLDFCGRVVSVGPHGTFKAGQLVFGAFSRSVQGGTLAQYIIAPSSECALLPEGVSTDSAAAVGTAGMTAYRSLLPEYVKPGSKVFINGGSGGVGTWAIQLAKMKGSEVTATCSTANVELCKSLGADNVLDYKKVDIISELDKIGPVFDLAIDNVGSIAGLYEHSHMFLKERGAFAQVAMTLGPSAFGTIARRMMLPRMLGGGSRKFYFIHTKTTTKDLVQIGEWMAAGRVKGVIDGVYEFEEAPKAFERLRAGRTRGKLIVHVGDKQSTEGI